MPIVTVTLIEGYDEETRAGLAERLTDAVRMAIGAPLDGITVVLNEAPAANYMRARRRRTPGHPPRSPAQIVRDYLGAMEARDLEAARGFLAEGFTMTFPGGATFRDPEDLVAWAAERYRAVAKTCQRFDEAPDGDGAVVYCFGTLNGEWPDGASFSGIRFIDRFVVRNGKIAQQLVWNDLGEAILERSEIGAR